MKHKDIKNYNHKGQAHGYQQLVWNGEVLYARGMSKNGKYIGYVEIHRKKTTTFYIR